jgi:DhnA-type fructose-1,6-bisphosphate aldolase and related enzymes
MKRRMNNIIQKDGKAFLVAMDHGTGVYVLPELNHPDKVIQDCIEGGADGFLMSAGTASRFADCVGNKGLLIRADGGTSDLNVNGAPFDLLVSVEDAIRLGADGVVCMDFPGATEEQAYSKILAKLVSDGAKWNMPVGAETLPRGFEFGKFDDLRTPHNLKLAARIGCELGADFIKTPYTGDKESFKELVDGCYRPVLILGGNKKGEHELFQEIRDSLDCGAVGVIMGRNIYRNDSPVKMCEAITALVHGNVTVDEAMKIIK